MAATILNALVPVFLVLGLGYGCGRRGWVDHRGVAGLNLFLMDFALPAAMFTAFSRTPARAILADGALMGVLALCMLACYGLTLLLELKVFKVEPGRASVQTLTVSLPNYASVGLPLLVSLYGPGAALSAVVAVAAGALTISPLTLVMLEHATGPDHPSALARYLRALGRTVLRPIVWAPVAGLGLTLAGVPVPDALDRAFTFLGQATAGVALFLTGLILSSYRLRVTPAVLVGVLFKNVAQPLLAYAAVRALGLPGPVAGRTVLLVAGPAGFSGLIFGSSKEVRNEAAGATMVLSTLLSAFTMAAAILLMGPG
jgi:malonate transporter